jgi:hypothetical protein
VIETYDQRLDKATAREKNNEVLKAIKTTGKFADVFINLGKDYLPAIDGIDCLFSADSIVYAAGGIGLKMAQMKRWLCQLC